MQKNDELNKRDSSSAVQRNSGQLGFLYSLPGILLAVSVYSVIHVLARLIASGNLGDDDPTDNLFIQVFSAGYSTDTGPLYNWVLWVLQHWMGTGINAFQTLKYFLLVVMAGFLFLATRRLTGSGLWGVLSVEALALTYQIAWRFHEVYTHRVGAMTLAIMTVWGVLNLLESRKWHNYLLLGIFIGLGLLTEHTYAVFLFSLLVALMVRTTIRSRIFSPWLLVTFSVAVLIIYPYAAWIAEDPQRVSAFLRGVFPLASQYTWAGFTTSLYKAVTFPVWALLPYIFILPLVFPGLVKEIFFRTEVWRSSDKPDYMQLLLHTMLIQFSLFLIFNVFVFQRSNYSEHSILPMWMIAMIWLTVKVSKSVPSPRRIKLFLALTIFVSVGAFGGRVANMYVLDPVCSICRWGIPYSELADKMREAGFDGGNVLTTDFELGGNLRGFFPDSRFVASIPWLTIDGPKSQEPEKFAVVWPTNETNIADLKRLEPFLPENLDVSTLQPVQADIPWTHLWKPKGYRYSNWSFVVLDSAGEAESKR